MLLCNYVTIVIVSRCPCGFPLPGHLDQLLVVDHLDVGVEQRHHAVHRLQVHAPVTRQVQVAHLQGGEGLQSLGEGEGAGAKV